MPSNPRLTYPQKSLDLEGSQIVYERLNQQLQRLSDYEGLSFTDCHSLNPNDLIKLLSGNNLNSLTHLRFNCCLGVNDEALQQLSQASSLTNLRSLDLARCRWFTNEGLRAILDSPLATQIKELNLSKCDCVNDDTLRMIASSPSLKNLETLILAKCYDITSQGIITLILSENASVLKVLDLSECWRIKDEALGEMSNSAYLKNVERLYLTGLNYITNQGIQYIVFSANFEQLKVLALANCFLLDDTAVRCIADSTYLANLEELNLNYNSKITSLGIEYLWESKNLLSIKDLHLKYIYLSLRADKAMALSMQFPMLERLSLNSDGLKHFMASENIDALREIHYGPCANFSDNFDMYDRDDTRAKKVILEKDFPYELNLPLFRNINVLCLSLPNLTDDTFHLLLAHSFESSLTTIKLHNLGSLSEFALKSLLSSNELMGNVKCLELKNISNLSNQCMKVFSKNKTVKLTEMRIKGNHESSQGLRLDASGLSSLILSPVCTYLKTLELKNLRLEEDILKYIAISDDMANLEKLILDGNFQEQKSSAAKDQLQAFKIFFGEQSKLKSLQILSLIDCPALTSKALEEIYRVYKSNQNLPALETVNIDSTDAMHPKLLQKVLASTPNLALNPRLKLKNFENASLKTNFDELFKICSANSQLLLIELSNIEYLNDKHLGSLAEVEAINSLRTMKLRNLPNIDGSFLHQWANPEHTSKFIYLQKIHLTNLSNFKSNGFEDFITQTNLEGLTKLEIRSCPFIGDDLLQALAGSSTIQRLHRLVLANLIWVTDAGISTILNSKVSNNLRILELRDLRNLHADTLEAIAHSKNLERLLTLKIINCQQIDSSLSTVLFDSTLLTSLANLIFDNPIIPNDTFLKSFVFTKLRNLVHFSLNFTGDFPRDGILELLRKPNVHMKHIVLSELVGKNLETIVNDDLIELLIKSDFIDLCLSLNVNDKNNEIHRISAERLLNVAQNSEFSLEKFLQNYGGLIDDTLLVRMGRWEIPDDDYWRRKVLLKNKDSTDTPQTRKSRRDSSPTRADTPTRKGFVLKIQDNYERENTPHNNPNAEQKEGPKFINFFAHLPHNYNFNALKKVTSEGIAKIIEFLPPGLDIMTFMKDHKDLLDDKVFAELIKKDSFQNLTSLPFDKFKSLTKESHKLLYKSNNKFFFAKMFDFTKTLKYKLDDEILSSVAKSKELLNVEEIKISKANLEMYCFDGLKEIFQSEFNDNVRKITVMDVYATQRSLDMIKETNTLKKLDAITIKNAGNDTYTFGFKSLVLSRKFSQIKHLHFHKCTLTNTLIEALANSHYVQDLTQIYLDKCIDENFLIQFSKLKSLKKLSELKLKKMFLPLEFFENLKHSNLPIEHLTLYQIKLTKGRGDILALLSQMNSAKIKNLVLDGIKISTKTIEAMNNSGVFSDLQSVVLSDDSFKVNQTKGTVIYSNGIREPSVRSSRYASSRTMSQRLLLNEDLSLVDFNKFINSEFIKHIRELKLLYVNLTDEWIDCLVDSRKLSNLVSVEFHPDCDISAVGIALIIESRKKLFRQLDLSLFFERNSKFIDEALIFYLSKQKKLHYLNKVPLNNEKVTSEGLISILETLDLKTNPKFNLPEFLFKVKDKVNDEVFKALSEQSFASVLKSMDLTVFKNVQEKSIYKLRVMMIDSEDKMNQLLREIPNIVDDDFIETICKCSLLNQPNNSEAPKTVNIKLDAGLHRNVTSRGLNTLIQKMCSKKFTVYHDWILLEDYWRSLLNYDTLSLIADDSICAPESLDLVNELDFEHNYYISTNGYQHLIRKELKSFQNSQDLAQKDKYLFVDTEDFLQRLNQNRFKTERISIDDAIGECLLKVISKCRHLKIINLKNKNFGDTFFRNLSVLLCQNSLHFLEEMNFCDNPRLTSTGLKYLYTAVVGNDSIKRIYLNCNPDLQSEINTFVDDGLYIFTKKKLLAIIGPGPKKFDHVFFFMCLYMIVAFPVAIWQYYEDRILQSKRVAQIKEVVKVLERPFLKPRRKRHMSILPISETLIPHYNENIRRKAEKVLQESYETIVPAENFYFTKNTIKLNEALKNSKLIFWIFFLNFVVYYIICISVPILFNSDGCQDGLLAMGFVIYGIYALAVFIFETLFYRFMINTLADNRALHFGPLSVIHLICSQTAKFDLFTDVIFIVNAYSCQDNNLALASTIFVVISVLFNATSTMMTIYSIWRGKNPHFSSHINRYAKLSLSTELHTIGHALDKFSTSNCVKWGNIYLPQIMVTAIGKFTLEDIPQFILQLIKLFAFSRQANIGLSLASTTLSLILSFRTAMKARPSVCKAEHVERLIKSDGKRIGQTDLLEDKLSGEDLTPNLTKEKTSSKLSGNEDEESLLARLQNSQISKNQPGQDVEAELSPISSERTCSDESLSNP